MATTYPSDVSGAKWYLAENKLSYPYVDGERATTPNGIKYSVVDAKNAYCPITVTIEGSTALLFDTENGAEIPDMCEVQFSGLVVRPYVSSATKRIAYSAKATGIRLVNQTRVKE